MAHLDLILRTWHPELPRPTCIARERSTATGRSNFRTSGGFVLRIPTPDLRSVIVTSHVCGSQLHKAGLCASGALGMRTWSKGASTRVQRQPHKNFVHKFVHSRPKTGLKELTDQVCQWILEIVLFESRSLRAELGLFGRQRLGERRRCDSATTSLHVKSRWSEYKLSTHPACTPLSETRALSKLSRLTTPKTMTNREQTCKHVCDERALRCPDPAGAECCCLRPQHVSCTARFVYVCVLGGVKHQRLYPSSQKVVNERKRLRFQNMFKEYEKPKFITVGMWYQGTFELFETSCFHFVNL